MKNQIPKPSNPDEYLDVKFTLAQNARLMKQNKEFQQDIKNLKYQLRETQDKLADEQEKKQNVTTKKGDLRMFTDEEKQKRQEKIIKINSESKKGNRVLHQHRIIIKFDECVELGGNQLIRETSREDAEQNVTVVRECGVSLDKQLKDFILKSTENENIELSEIEYHTRICNSDETKEIISGLIDSILDTFIKNKDKKEFCATN